MYFVIDIDEVIDQPQNSTPDGDEVVNTDAVDYLVIRELLERSFTEDPATDIATTNLPSTSVGEPTIGEPSTRIAPIQITSEYINAHR